MIKKSRAYKFLPETTDLFYLLISVIFFLGAGSCAHIDSGTPANLQENSYAVVIGIEKYRDIPKVDYAVNDAQVMYESLTRQMGYPKENILLLTDEKATKTDIQKAIEKWLKNQTDNSSRVFIYYAGHGAPNPTNGEAFIVPYDGDPSYIETTGYSLRSLRQSLSELPTDNIIVVMDSCFSGTGGRSVLAKGARPLVITEDNPLAKQGKAVVFSATQNNQISTSYPEVGHGLFTYFFLKGMQEGDANNDGNVDVKEVFEYLKSKVQKQAKKQNVEQVPALYPSSDILGAKAQIRLISNLQMVPKIVIEGSREPAKKEPKLPAPGF